MEVLNTKRSYIGYGRCQNMLRMLVRSYLDQVRVSDRSMMFEAPGKHLAESKEDRDWHVILFL